MEKEKNAAHELQDFAEEDLKKKQEAENARKALEAKLNQLLEKGKKTGKLKFKDLEFLEDANARQSAREFLNIFSQAFESFPCRKFFACCRARLTDTNFRRPC